MEKKILIVEDEKFLRNIFSDAIKNLGVIQSVSNGQEGLHLLKKNSFDVIVSDIRMPIMDGIAFFKEASKINPSIKRHFLFVSAMICPEVRTFLEANNLAYLEKPFELKKLIKLVEAIIKKPSD